jgi:peroxiredoxin Q/BCP
MSKLNQGDMMPEFSTTDHNGHPVTAETLKGKKSVIYFYPKDMTPGCTAQACNIRDNYDVLLKNNFNVIGISPDTVKSHQKFAEKHKLPFPLIADTDKSLAKAFGVWGRKKFMGREYDGINRTTFVFDENGVLTELIDKVNTKEHTSQIIN